MIQPLNINSKISKLLASMSDWLFDQTLEEDLQISNTVDLSKILEPKKYYYFDKIINSKLLEFVKVSPYLKLVPSNTKDTIEIKSSSIVFLYSDIDSSLVDQKSIKLTLGWNCFYTDSTLTFSNDLIRGLMVAYRVNPSDLENIKHLIETEPQIPKKRKIIEIKAV
jgi:hypothetical protein